MSKRLEVVGAVILQEGRVLATQRSYGPLAGGWEFPGGKVEPGEAPQQALHREIREELDAAIAIERHLVTVQHDYDDFSLELSCYICRLAPGGFHLLEHSDARWLGACDIDSVAWLPADRGAIEAIKASGILK